MGASSTPTEFPPPDPERAVSGRKFHAMPVLLLILAIAAAYVIGGVVAELVCAARACAGAF